MSIQDDFAQYAKLLSELSQKHRDVAAWCPRSDLPGLVNDFWSNIGVSALTQQLAPGVTPEEDDERLAAAFEPWFEDAATRDHWQLGPQDEPIPRSRLPARPRLAQRWTGVLVASDVADDPSLWAFGRYKPVARPVPFTYLRWCLFELLNSGTSRNSTYIATDHGFPAEAIRVGDWTPVSRLDDGIYVLHKASLEASPDAILIYRDLALFSSFVLSRQADQREVFAPPKGAEIQVKIPKTLKIDPKGTKFEQGLTLIPRRGVGQRYWNVTGQVDGRWAWFRNLEPGTVGVTCEDGDRDAIQAWLTTRGAQVVHTGKLQRALSCAWE